ncbi:polyprenol phosphomannose-dependent alpha 1,6 mannosyltransferase MptB [Nocardioides zeicaulis]|uniref:Polyprenol phosphomannose-dependent alpha 1,6 mannosyltransferase MptB n=1 Tax=Nocardioides zeicaulis TaxID=1776857 RepID=A0ABV6E4A5_9ACTN
MVRRGVLGYVLVLVGGLVVSVLPASSAVASLPLVADLRSSTGGRMLGLAVVVVGLGLASSAWLRLVRAAGDLGVREDDRTALVHRATAAWTLPLLLAPPLFSRDGWSYAAQGVLTHLGLSPYVWTPSILDGQVVEAVDPMWLATATPYGPLPLVWGSAAAGLTTDPWLLVVAHRLLALVGLALLAWAVPRLSRWSRVDPARASALVLASPLVLAHGVGGVHNDLLMAGLAAVALVVAARHGWLVGALVVGLGVAVKLPAGVAGVGVVLVTLPAAARVSARATRATQVGAVSLLTVVCIGAVSHLGVGWVHALGVPGEVQTPLSVSTQLGRLAHLLTGADLVDAFRTAGSVLLVVVAVTVGLRSRSGDRRTALRATAAVALALVVLSPVVHHWYVLWCLPFLAAVELPARGWQALLHASWLGGLVAPLDSSLRGADAVIAVGVAVVAATALVQAVGHRRAEIRAEVRAGAQARTGDASPTSPISR